jgi:DMSO/TMAO reductase YedYZ molybdopterin-dependent catalytic subunit
MSLSWIGWLRVAALVAPGIAFTVTAQTPSATNTLSVSGNVAQPLTLSVDDLRRYPAHAVEYPGRGLNGSPS